MTAPLHLLHQLYSNLPALNGHVAAHAAVGQELQLMAQKAQDKEYRRDVVEVVAEVNPGAASGVVRPGTEPKVRTDFKEKGHIRPRALSRKAKGSLARAGEVDAPLVSVKV